MRLGIVKRPGNYTGCGGIDEGRIAVDEKRSVCWNAKRRGVSASRLQGIKRRNGPCGNHDALRGLLPLLQGLDQSFDGLTSIGRNEDRGGQCAVAHPSLAGVRQAVASRKGQLEPAFALCFAREFLKSF